MIGFLVGMSFVAVCMAVVNHFLGPVGVVLYLACLGCWLYIWRRV